ncbi:MAG: hypothetical protein ACKVGW_11260 [Verrucomicrobiia bacterium]|jgi:hypothetical protein
MYYMADHTYGASGGMNIALDSFKAGFDKNGGQNRDLDRRINKYLGITLVRQNKPEEAKQHFIMRSKAVGL